jgi:hypothetical protein
MKKYNGGTQSVKFKLITSMTFIAILSLFLITFGQDKKTIIVDESSIITFIETHFDNPSEALKELRKSEFEVERKVLEFNNMLNSDVRFKARFLKDPFNLLKERGLHEIFKNTSINVPDEILENPIGRAICFDSDCIEWGYEPVYEIVRDPKTDKIDWKLVGIRRVCLDWEIKFVTCGTCYGPDIVIFKNRNIYQVDNDGDQPTFNVPHVPPDQAYCLVAISTYHYNDGKGQEPGGIGIMDNNGTETWWQASATPLGDIQNVNWWANIDEPFILRASEGPYTILDSDQPSWSQNFESNGKGFTLVEIRKYAEN